MKKNSIKFLLLLFFLNSCAGMPKYTSIPVNPNDVCDIFNQKTHWYYHSKKSEDNLLYGLLLLINVFLPGRAIKLNPDSPWIIAI